MTATKKLLLAIGMLGILFIAGCSDDDEAPAAAEPEESDAEPEEVSVTTAEPEEVTVTSAEPEEVPVSSADEYCALIEEIGDALPDDAMLDRLIGAAPDEIVENLELVAEAIRAEGEAAFSDPDVVANFAPIETFEVENCGSGEEAAEVNPDAERVEVTATEYAFEYLDPSTTGAVSFLMANSGEEVHEILLARLLDDTSLDDALASEDPEAAGLVETVGFAGPVAPGADIVLNVDDLTPGRYAMVCFIPAPDGVSHAEKGMVSQFTVG